MPSLLTMVPCMIGRRAIRNVLERWSAVVVMMVVVIRFFAVVGG
jgi:hypothetical protein